MYLVKVGKKTFDFSACLAYHAHHWSHLVKYVFANTLLGISRLSSTKLIFGHLYQANYLHDFKIRYVHALYVRDT
jgi:hypothetical protein